MLLTAALLLPHPSLLTTGSRPGLEPTSLLGEPFWGTQLRSLHPPTPDFNALVLALSLWEPASEMLADLIAGEMHTLHLADLTFSRACRLAGVTTELSAWVPLGRHSRFCASVLKKMMGRSNGFSLNWWPWIFSAGSWALSTLPCSLWDFHVLSMSPESHNAVLTKLLSSSSPGMRAVGDLREEDLCHQYAPIMHEQGLCMPFSLHHTIAAAL